MLIEQVLSSRCKLTADKSETPDKMKLVQLKGANFSAMNETFQHLTLVDKDENAAIERRKIFEFLQRITMMKNENICEIVKNFRVDRLFTLEEKEKVFLACSRIIREFSKQILIIKI
uniref:Uncharacterized protein n=1 Tax=Onchocerca volvulus TaxID=6282 RepID=A0A8R1TKS3_ONCVO